ncbi:hypothetical protein CRG98_001270 [Punica granatum]|uniref:AAA-type ATPase N-terminal domain-containing protein n=1 Tax=Punica granatum TaxID=22663 RepID=A0A2I0LCC0_PUNGR|nr:hypothetical protein CRG98_001270 [Punica granatum]
MAMLKNMPSTTSVLSTYTTFAASAMLMRTMLNEVHNISRQFIPQKLRDRVLSGLDGMFGNRSAHMTLIFDEYKGLSIDEIYQTSEAYLGTRISLSIQQLNVSKLSEEKSITITVDKWDKIVNIYEGITLTWEFVCTETQTAKPNSKPL